MTFNPKALWALAGFVVVLALALKGQVWAFGAIAAALIIEGLFWAGAFGVFRRQGRSHLFRDH